MGLGTTASAQDKAGAAELANEWVMGLVGSRTQRRVRDAFLHPGCWYRLPDPTDWSRALALSREVLDAHCRATPDWVDPASPAAAQEMCCEGPVVDRDFAAACCSEDRSVRVSMLAILVVGCVLDGLAR